MKKVFLFAIGLVLAGAVSAQSAPANAKATTNANKQGYCNFVDKNNDGICDNFTDADKDGKCDNCVHPNGICPKGQNGKYRQGQCQGMGQGNGRGAKGQCRASCAGNVTVKS